MKRCQMCGEIGLFLLDPDRCDYCIESYYTHTPPTPVPACDICGAEACAGVGHFAVCSSECEAEAKARLVDELARAAESSLAAEYERVNEHTGQPEEEA